MARPKKTPSMRELQAQMEALQKQIDSKAQEDKLAELAGSAEFKSVLRHVKRLGLTAGEVAELLTSQAPAKRGKGSAKKAPAKRASGSKVPPKYRHPDDDALTWTGRGKHPRWVAAALEQGLTLERMLIA